MQILGNIFNAIIFVSAIGGMFCVLSLFINHILRCTPPLWFPLCGMILFCVPFLSPDVFLISPETQEWLNGFYIVCWIWVCGCGILFVYDTIRSIMAKRALKGYQTCSNERLNALCLQCAEIVGLKKVPALYWGSLDNPICVTGVFRPTIIMSKTVIEKLTDIELSAVFFHELTHIKRKHILLEHIYDYVCILNWLNPFAWIAKGDFSLHCETDCDCNALKFSQGKVTATEYAAAIIRLLELSTVQATKPGKGIGALSFVLTKRRIKRITTRTSKIRDRMITVILAVALILTVAFSVQFSREHFYPYPAYNTGTEYGAGYNE